MPEVALSCPACGADNGPGSRFCSSCGSALVAACPQCGAPASGRFCSSCGTALTASTGLAPDPPPAATPAPVAERRVTTVLFGDLVGFTPLSESRDAEDVRELLSRYFAVARTVIARYGGTVEKFIGDAVMAVWGVPVAHEDDAERAVRAGLDLVDAVAALGDEVRAHGLSMRVGLVTGEVAVTLGAAGEGMVAGDPVNTAARVQTAAAPGEVWVDETTRALSAAAVVYADAGTHHLKGKAEPMPLFAARQVVATVGGAQRVDGLEAPFVGRDREMRLVKELFHGALEERRPRLVSVFGQPGIGKSRLGWEFFKYIDGISDLVRWHRGRCLSYGDGVAFWALAEMVRSRFDILEGDDPLVVVEKLDAGLRRWVSDAEERSWLRPRLGTLLGVADQVGAETSTSDDLFAAWQLFFERLADDGEAVGVALLIEDLQWADDGLLDFIEQLIERSRTPIFILTLARPELTERRPSWASGRRATALYLEPLSRQSMSSLVSGLVEGLSEETRTALVERAEGVPLYAVETVRTLIDRDQVVPREGRYVVAVDEDKPLDLDAIGAPTSLQTLLAARLDALPAPERTAVQNASVLGLAFTRAALAALTGDDARGLDDVLDALVRKEIVVLDSDPRSPERGQYRFVQAMVRGVAYETLSRRDRKARHLRAAQHLSQEPDADAFAAVLAHHYLDAREALPDEPDATDLVGRAVELLERAAERARALGSPSQALRHYLTALPWADDDETKGRLSVGAAESALAAGRAADAITFAEDAVAAFDRTGRRVDAAYALTVAADATNNTGTVGDMPERLIAVYDSLEESAETRRVLARLAMQIARGCFAGRADAKSGAVWGDRASALADGEEDPLLLAQCISGYAAILMTTGRPTMGLGLLRVALELARDNDLPRAQLRPLNNLASYLAGRDIRQAQQYAEEGLALAGRLGDMDTGAYLTGTASAVYWLGGEWDALLGLDLMNSGNDPFLTLVYGVYSRLALSVRGEAMPPLVDVRDEVTAAQLRSAVLTMRTLTLLDDGDERAAVASAREAVNVFFDFGGFDDDFPTYWALYMDAALNVGDTDGADEWLRRVTDAPRGQLSNVVRALVPYFRARATAAREGEAALIDADFMSGAAALAAFGAPYWHARCLLGHGEWLIAEGRASETTALTDEAERIFTSLRAAPWIDRARKARALALR